MIIKLFVHLQEVYESFIHLEENYKTLHSHTWRFSIKWVSIYVKWGYQWVSCPQQSLSHNSSIAHLVAPLSINADLVHNELCPEPIFRAFHCSVHSEDHVLHNQHLSYIIRIKSKCSYCFVGFETHDLKEVRTIVPTSNLHLNIYNNVTPYSIWLIFYTTFAKPYIKLPKVVLVRESLAYPTKHPTMKFASVNLHRLVRGYLASSVKHPPKKFASVNLHMTTQFAPPGGGFVVGRARWILLNLNVLLLVPPYPHSQRTSIQIGNPGNLTDPWWWVRSYTSCHRQKLVFIVTNYVPKVKGVESI
jgi:hypothetical protein